jgi:hypothetical protein
LPCDTETISRATSGSWAGKLAGNVAGGDDDANGID